MGTMRITMKCHEKGCKNRIDEKIARWIGINWYYCTQHAKKYGGVGDDFGG